MFFEKKITIYYLFYKDFNNVLMFKKILNY